MDKNKSYYDELNDNLSEGTQIPETVVRAISLGDWALQQVMRFDNEPHVPYGGGDSTASHVKGIRPLLDKVLDKAGVDKADSAIAELRADTTLFFDIHDNGEEIDELLRVADMSLGISFEGRDEIEHMITESSLKLRLHAAEQEEQGNNYATNEYKTLIRDAKEELQLLYGKRDAELKDFKEQRKVLTEEEYTAGKEKILK